MNKVLVTGLGTVTELGLCEACNLDFSWLVNNPSTLLWADELCIPKLAFEKEKMRNDSKRNKVVSMFLSMAEQNGLINTIDIASMYQEKVGFEIANRVSKDSQALLQAFPETIKKGEEGVPGEIVIGEERYCNAWMASIYTGIKLAHDIDANCLFSKREHHFLKYLYGLDGNEIAGNTYNRIYNEIFSIYLPESLSVHSYAFADEEECQNCVKYEACKDNYLVDTEKALKKIFEWRDYDELQQAKGEINTIIKAKNSISSENDIKDIVKEFREKQNVINKNINKRFPKIERWTKMTTVMATPLTIVSAVTGNIPLTIASAAAIGVSEATEKLLDVYKSKNNWIGFVNNMKEY